MRSIMNPNPPPNESDIGNRNLERLLTEAYAPEIPDPEFVWSLKEALCATARELTQTNAHTVWSPITGDAGSRALSRVHGTDGPLSPHELRLRRLRRSLGWTMTAAAAVAGVALFLHAWYHQPGDLVERDPRADLFADLSGMDYLTPRPRQPAPPPSVAAIGDSLETTAGQRRRVQLPDGSVLYLNQRTTVAVASERHLILKSGEVFIEVAPRSADADGATFVVQTATREVTALGTKFAVQIDGERTGVIVTQGKVRISGLASLLYAGQQLAPGSDRPASLPRASHVLDWTRDLMAAAESPLVPASQYTGGALIAVDPYGQQAPLSLRKYHVDVHVEDGFARTTIDQTYFNAQSWRMEGTFYFPLPPDASLSRLAMYVDGNLMEGGMAERDFARNVYETIVTRQQDPALLEWVDGSTFKMRVFPLEGRQEKRIILSYTQRLPAGFGQATYRFPAGHSLEAVRDWSFHARIKGGAGLGWQCDSHPLQATKDGGDLLLDGSDRQVKIDRDITLTLLAANAGGSSEELARFATTEHEGSRYLMVRYRPALPGQPQRQRRDWVILFESSSSRDPLLARVQIDVIRSLLANAEHDDTFVLFTAGTRVRRFADEPVPATPENVRSATEFLERTHLVGALDLGQALAEAEPFLKAGQNPHLVHVGSGIATLGERRADVLARRLPAGVRYVGVGVGKRWSRAFMAQAAERTGGYFTQINPDELIAWRGFELAATLNTPRLLNVQVMDDSETLTFLNTNPSLAQGEELCAIARIGSANQPLPKLVTIRGTWDGQPFERIVPVQKMSDHADYLPRTWAELQVERLLAEDAEKNRPKIVSLSKAMYVMTPFTSLLVLENEEMYRRFNVDRGRKDQWAMYPCPARIPVVRESEPEQQDLPRSVPPLTERKPAAQEVLQTLLVRVPPGVLTAPQQRTAPSARLVLAGLKYTGAYAVPLGKSRRDPGPTEGPMVPIDLSKVEAQESPTPQPLVGGRPGGNRPVAGAETWWYPREPHVWPLDGRSMRGAASFASLGQWSPVPPGNSSAELSAEPGATPHVPHQSLPGGSRPVTVPVNAEKVAGGFVVPNRQVDVIATRRFPSGEYRAQIILTNIRVLAVDTAWNGSRVPADVTLELSATQAARLARFQRTHTFSFALRPPDEASKAAPGEDVVGSDDPFVIVTEGLAGNSLDPVNRVGFSPPAVNDQEAITAIEATAERMSSAQIGSSLYRRPSFTNDPRIYFDLVGYAPGMNTSHADVQAILEAEAASDSRIAPGTIDPAARRLIDAARSGGWQSVVIPAAGHRRGFRVVCDGSGRYRYERTLPEGLREVVVCDGKTLLHLYPDLGIGARRAVSRFHRVEFAQLVPWVLPPVDDLARGADLKCVDDHTVAIVPRGADAARRPDGSLLPYSCLQMVFADGRVIERRLVEMPGGRLLGRESYDVAGTVRSFDEAAEEVKVQALAIQPGQAPELKPVINHLVILALPYRTPIHLLGSLKTPTKRYEDLDPGTALALFATEDRKEALTIFRRCFHARGDRRLGFYTLLAAAGHRLDSSDPVLRVLAEHPLEPLAQYLAGQQNSALAIQLLLGINSRPPSGFVAHLTEFALLSRRWQRTPAGDVAGQLGLVLDFIRRNPTSLLAPALLCQVQEQVKADAAASLVVAEAWQALRDVPGLRYVARYEQARCLLQSGQRSAARRLFGELYAQTLAEGILPPLDTAFRQAMQSDGTDTDLWSPQMWQTAKTLLASQRRIALVALAWQCNKIGDPALGDALVAATLQNLSDDRERLTATLAAIEYCWQFNQFAQIDKLLPRLLEHESFAQHASLWRLAAMLANHREQKARSIDYLERALDIEFRHPPATIDLQAVRSDYSAVLSHYQTEALALARRRELPSREFVAKVLRTADRWRALDSNNTFACEFAARILQSLGAPELAWDYLTTGIDLRPDEANPWLALAQSLSQDGEYSLADRAYAAAFEMESTNAQILWDRARNLNEAGKRADARTLLRQIADGQWQPRFQEIQAKARQQVRAR
jgi:ferric-dicitrate binding protein FerR (iron transport regulator)